MAASAPDRVRHLRAIYSESRDRIGMVLSHLGSIRPEEPQRIPSVETMNEISNLLNSVVGSQRFENENSYRSAIVSVGEWCLSAFQREFLEFNAEVFPSPLFVVRKGVEVLHLLLHRDLRRRQLSSVESQIFYEFAKLAEHLPDPRNQRLSQDDVDETMNQLLNKKIS